MNTNNNVYTLVYTTIIVVVVAALLAFVSQSLKSKQEANEKAETISQMLTAAGYGSKAELDRLDNASKLGKYAEEIQEAFTIDTLGVKVEDLPLDKVFSPSELKKQNYNIKGADEPVLPVFIFKNGSTVVPVYGAGLWGPVWGYIAFITGTHTILGAYFDHESETAGLGARIKDDPVFQAQFCNQVADFDSPNVFEIVKGGSPKDEAGLEIDDNKIDAITGATMTSQGLDKAIDTWLWAYSAFFRACVPAEADEECTTEEETNAEEVSE